MPVSLEQWRASVGANNSAHSHMLKYWGSKRAPKNLLDHLILCHGLVSLFTLGAGPVTAEVEAFSLGKQSSGHTHEGGGWRWLRAITVVMMLLWCSGDVELNPGPLSGPFDLTSDNLADVCDLTFGARLQWLDLGLELGLNVTTLYVIQRNNSNDVEVCFRDMLLEWLRKTSPPPTWKALIAALEKDCIRCPEVTKKIKRACGLDPEDFIATNSSATVSQGASTPGNPVTYRSESGCVSDMQKQLDYQIIVYNTYQNVKQSGTDVNSLRVLLTSLLPQYKGEHSEFFQELKKEFDPNYTLEDLWAKLNEYWDYLNYTLLESLICRLDNHSLKQEMDGYLIAIKSFQNCTRLCDFAGNPSFKRKAIISSLKEFVVRLELKWEVCTLADIDELARHIIRKFNLPSFSMILNKVSPGSVVITWSLPSRVKSDIENTDMTSFYKEHGILSISIDGDECKYSAIRNYSAYLKDLYSQKRGKNLAAFKLAKIESRKVGIELDKFTRSTLRGDQDDVVYNKDDMKEEEVCCSTHVTRYKQPRLVLIEGAPGVSKTTFSELFCHKWSQGQRLSNHRLLVLLPLRDNKVRSAKNVSDLFQHPQLQHAIAQEMERSGGEGMALWLEAWDELEEEMREKSSLFLELVHGHLLPKATVLVTSRPWASHNIRKEADQHMEIVSTPSTQFSRILREGRVKPDSRKKFLDYVDFNPYMKAAMHTPVTADIVTDVFQWSRDTDSPPPTAMTQLYVALTCKLLMEHLSRNKAGGKQPPKIQFLDEVPTDVKKQLLNLCRLSWEGLVRQQITFSIDAVGRDTLGLMHAVPELYGGEDSQLSYHFIHLTLQEFLAAFHISQLPSDTQQQVIEQHVSTGHLTTAVRFFFGLTEPNTFISSLTSHYITAQLHSESASVYHWLYEAGDVGKHTEGLDADKDVCVKSSYTWNPLDYYVLGYVISQCSFRWILDFFYSSMGDEEMEMFCKGINMSTVTTCKEISVLNLY